VEVIVEVADGWVGLTVVDDGVGFGELDERGGLANLRQRAQRHGGEFSLRTAQPHGCVLRWSVPISSVSHRLGV
jgi:signal transduction histidine kinase